MSFVEMLKQLRDEAKENIEKNNDVEERLSEEQTHINIPVVEEVKTDNNVVIPAISIGDAIIKQSAESLIKVKKAKLKNISGASRRVAKAIASKNIKMSQLNKAIDIQRRSNPKRGDWHVVGSYALQQLIEKLESGMSLNQALNSNYEKRD